MTSPDLILRGGRVIDPESGRDEIADVAVTGDRVTEIGNDIGPGPVELDVTGNVVTAGFVDLHSHVNGIGGLRLQALDGVTTALELEAGRPRSARHTGRPRRKAVRSTSALPRRGRWPGWRLSRAFTSTAGSAR